MYIIFIKKPTIEIIKNKKRIGNNSIIFSLVDWIDRLWLDKPEVNYDNLSKNKPRELESIIYFDFSLTQFLPDEYKKEYSSEDLIDDYITSKCGDSISWKKLQLTAEQQEEGDREHKDYKEKEFGKGC